MTTRHLAALAVAAAFISTPAAASDIANYEGPGMKFYYSIPLDARTPKQAAPSFGLQIKGNRPYEVVNIDQRLVNSFLPLGGLEAKWVIAGLVAAGAGVAVATKDKSTKQSYQNQQAQQAAECAATPNCP